MVSVEETFDFLKEKKSFKMCSLIYCLGQTFLWVKRDLQELRFRRARTPTNKATNGLKIIERGMIMSFIRFFQNQQRINNSFNSSTELKKNCVKLF